jgi:hypothetical protein
MTGGKFTFGLATILTLLGWYVAHKNQRAKFCGNFLGKWMVIALRLFGRGSALKL